MESIYLSFFRLTNGRQGGHGIDILAGLLTRQDSYPRGIPFWLRLSLTPPVLLRYIRIRQFVLLSLRNRYLEICLIILQLLT